MVIKIMRKVEKSQLEKYIINNNYFENDFYNKQLNLSQWSYPNIKQYLTEPTNFVLNNNEIIGSFSFKRLEWDSAIFNTNMWKMNISINLYSEEIFKVIQIELLNQVKEKEIQHLSCQVKTKCIKTIHLLEKLTFENMDTIIRFGTHLSKGNNHDSIYSNGIKIRLFESKDYMEVIKLSQEVFHNYPNRFQNDPAFSTDDSNKLYNEWIKNSLNGFADVIVVAEKENKIVGFSTIKYKEHNVKNKIVIAEGQLAGVAAEVRGNGINTKMLKERLMIASNYADFYEVGTQIYNYASQKTFYKCGLKPIDSYFSFHKNFK